VSESIVRDHDPVTGAAIVRVALTARIRTLPFFKDMPFDKSQTEICILTHKCPYAAELLSADETAEMQLLSLSSHVPDFLYEEVVASCVYLFLPVEKYVRELVWRAGATADSTTISTYFFALDDGRWRVRTLSELRPAMHDLHVEQCIFVSLEAVREVFGSTRIYTIAELGIRSASQDVTFEEAAGASHLRYLNWYLSSEYFEANQRAAYIPALHASARSGHLPSLERVLEVVHSYGGAPSVAEWGEVIDCVLQSGDIACVGRVHELSVAAGVVWTSNFVYTQAVKSHKVAVLDYVRDVLNFSLPTDQVGVTSLVHTICSNSTASVLRWLLVHTPHALQGIEARAMEYAILTGAIDIIDMLRSAELDIPLPVNACDMVRYTASAPRVQSGMDHEQSQEAVGGWNGSTSQLCLAERRGHADAC
jgi:hypothetical protein